MNERHEKIERIERHFPLSDMVGVGVDIELREPLGGVPGDLLRLEIHDLVLVVGALLQATRPRNNVVVGRIEQPVPDTLHRFELLEG